MQTQGSLAEAPLASLLQAMQSERATGTLSVEDGENDCALYFLFGHLFHASGPRGQGEDVVVDALGWGQGTFHFDPRAKLPAEETIKASPAELIAEAQQRQPSDDSPESNGAGSEPAGVPDAPAEGGEGDGLTGTEQTTATATPSPPWDSGNQSEAAPAYSAWSQPAVASPAPVAEASTWATRGSGPEPPADHPADSTYPAPVAVGPEPGGRAEPAGEGAHGRRSTDASPLAELYPLPAGRAVYAGLKSAFVDFPRLLRTLRTDTHTGYVRLSGDEFTGILLFQDGQLLEALAKTSTARHGEPAFTDVQARMERGEGILDVIELPGDTVAALAQLLMARPMFTGLLGRFINFAALLEYLAEERVDGSVIVVTDDDTGVILLRGGEVLGTYTQTQAGLDQSTDGVQQLATQPSARVEVKGGMRDTSGIDVEAALNRPS